MIPIESLCSYLLEKELKIVTVSVENGNSVPRGWTNKYMCACASNF